MKSSKNIFLRTIARLLLLGLPLTDNLARPCLAPFPRLISRKLLHKAPQHCVTEEAAKRFFQRWQRLRERRRKVEVVREANSVYEGAILEVEEFEIRCQPVEDCDCLAKSIETNSVRIGILGIRRRVVHCGCDSTVRLLSS
jgi:hypothetical protein